MDQSFLNLPRFFEASLCTFYSLGHCTELGKRSYGQEQELLFKKKTQSHWSCTSSDYSYPAYLANKRNSVHKNSHSLFHDNVWTEALLDATAVFGLDIRLVYYYSVG